MFAHILNIYSSHYFLNIYVYTYIDVCIHIHIYILIIVVYIHMAHTIQHCGMSKARQKNLVKQTDIKSQKRGEKLFIDSSWSTQPTYGGTKYWLLVMDDNTGFLWSHFLENKSDTSDVMINLIKHLEKLGVIVKSISTVITRENT